MGYRALICCPRCHRDFLNQESIFDLVSTIDSMNKKDTPQKQAIKKRHIDEILRNVGVAGWGAFIPTRQDTIKRLENRILIYVFCHQCAPFTQTKEWEMGIEQLVANYSFLKLGSNIKLMGEE